MTNTEDAEVIEVTNEPECIDAEEGDCAGDLACDCGACDRHCECDNPDRRAEMEAEHEAEGREMNRALREEAY